MAAGVAVTIIDLIFVRTAGASCTPTTIGTTFVNTGFHDFLSLLGGFRRQRVMQLPCQSKKSDIFTPKSLLSKGLLNVWDRFTRSFERKTEVSSVPKRDRTISTSTPTTEAPRCIRPYTYHGVEFHKRDSKEWVGVCPFCYKPKFHVDSETGRSDCKVCLWQEQFKEDGITGNHYGFIKYLWRISYDKCKLIDYGWLSTHRNLSAESLKTWGVCKSVITGEWLVPGYGVKDSLNITQLYKYVNLKDHYDLLPTPGFAEGESHGIILPRDYNGDATKLYICEGVWDAIALYTSLQMVSETELRGDCVAVPGCGVFKDSWIKYTSGKDIVLLYDNDHPRKNIATNTVLQPALSGTKRASGIIRDTSTSVSWLDWNLDGKGYDPDLTDGYDVRDWLVKDNKSVEKLLTYIRPIPDSWISQTTTSNSSQKIAVVERIRPVPCNSWKVLQNAFRLAAKWTPELDAALAVSLSCVCSVNGIGEPLWVRLISPASTYKSKLCKALGTNDKYTVMDDGMNGFYSGAITKDGKDYSLVTRWNGKCLITKEGSTLFTNPLSEQIIGEARAIYDGEVDRDWKNGKRVVHRGWKGTWLLAGTPNMKDYDDNELGPRFIDCRIVKNITDDLADDIVMRAMLEQAESGIANCKVDSSENPEYLNARKLCGGYIGYLRQDIDDGTLRLPTISHQDIVNIGVLGKFVERMRSRPPKKTQSENTEIALHARICKQLVKLAQFLTVILQKISIDKEVMNMVYKIALDTADGWSYQIVNVLVGASRDGDEGLESHTITKRCNKDLRQMGPLLIHLLEIGVLEWYKPTNMPLPVRIERMRLTNSFRMLYNQLKSIQER